LERGSTGESSFVRRVVRFERVLIAVKSALTAHRLYRRDISSESSFSHDLLPGRRRTDQGWFPSSLLTGSFPSRKKLSSYSSTSEIDRYLLSVPKEQTTTLPSGESLSSRTK